MDTDRKTTGGAKRVRVSARSEADRLEQECVRRQIRLMYDDLKSEGGFCRLRDSFYLVINRRASTETRVRLMTDALARVETIAAKSESRIPKPEAGTEVGASPKPEVTSEVPETRAPEPAAQESEVEADRITAEAAKPVEEPAEVPVLVEH